MTRLQLLSVSIIFFVVFTFVWVTSSFTLDVFAQTPPNAALSCTFTRSDQNPKAAPYSSPLLLSYFQQASQKTGVPAAVLAAISRVEATTDVYSISDYTDDDVRAME